MSDITDTAGTADMDWAQPPCAPVAQVIPVVTPSIIVLKGPPGTGKTTALVDAFIREARGECGPQGIAVIAFTNAARDEVMDRLRAAGFDADDLKYVRTFDSICFSLARVPQSKLLTDEKRQTFRKQSFGSLPSEVARLYESVIDRGRVAGLAPNQLLSQLSPVEARRINAPQFHRYHAAYAAYLQTHGLITFEEVRQKVLGHQLRPNVEVLIVDEGQDLSPSTAELVDFWIEDCDRVYIAGDDDQAIYRFAGGSPAWFQRMFIAHNGTTLAQSHRIPVAVHSVAMKVITQVSNRLPGAYAPTANTGKVLRGVTFAQLPKLLTGAKNLVLGRDKVALDKARAALDAAGVAYENASGAEGKAHGELLDMASLGKALSSHGSVRAERLLGIVQRRQRADDTALRGHLETLGSGFVSSVELRSKLGQVVLLDELDAGTPEALGRLTRSQRKAVLAELTGKKPPNEVIVSTIHGSKGQQADVVAVIADRSKASAQAEQGNSSVRDDELRLLYVAVTRAKDTLILMAPCEAPCRAFRFP